ncbi:acetyl-coenzyme A transporter 1 isoform X4 [Homo sapiens]|uniref:acetyl-coenzyme A transporter 1 isoform X4 n=1 Tax=Homo sapiens TaxID=9606 RepID=UPI0007DC81D7|nr:acetyl-coenzyme A transporter 1 isoform X4 [Homo sapiens]XP_047305153.1 acetyl-coenzyme A transporter 1 isoform X4 [Homo sapiens]XP_054204345.1 acetyl-coenzyme A transporter 1 isoform X4 [Homo sapiens]|eukprot:XP_016862952.1 acetyl-coenzyme A transporter 1 isoform X3 [Homo sapiens]
MWVMLLLAIRWAKQRVTFWAMFCFWPLNLPTFVTNICGFSLNPEESLLFQVVYLSYYGVRFIYPFERVCDVGGKLINLLEIIVWEITQDFLFFWGTVFLITTTLVALLKKENEVSVVKEETQGITDTYKLLFAIIKMPAVLTFCLLILTAKIGFSAADAVTGLKLVEEGVPKEHLALLAVPMVPLQIILPLIISKYTAGPQPLNTFYKAMPYRLLLGLEYALLVWWTPKVEHQGGFPIYYYIVVLLSYALHQVTVYSMYVSIMAFNAKVSDPLIGGTYMTLLNTVSNLGGNWPSTVALWLVDPLTVKECVGASNQNCRTPDAVELCKKLGGSCVTALDGYYVESIICVFIGFGWWFFLGPKFKKLQDEGSSSWKCKRNN